MCGSGTILAEALMHYCKIPAQKLRSKFGFFNMPEFDQKVWENLKENCDKEIRPLPKGIILWQRQISEAIKVANANLSRLPFYECCGFILLNHLGR